MYIYIYILFFCLSEHAQSFPPCYRNIQEYSHRLRESTAQKEQRSKTKRGFAAYATLDTFLSSTLSKNLRICSYIQIVAQNPIETLKTIIHNVVS